MQLSKHAVHKKYDSLLPLRGDPHMPSSPPPSWHQMLRYKSTEIGHSPSLRTPSQPQICPHTHTNTATTHNPLRRFVSSLTQPMTEAKTNKMNCARTHTQDTELRGDVECDMVNNGVWRTPLNGFDWNVENNAGLWFKATESLCSCQSVTTLSIIGSFYQVDHR